MWLTPSAITTAAGYGSRRLMRNCASGRDEPRRERGASRVAAVLAEQVQLLLHRAIRETEQHRILLGLVGDPLPARHHEQVPRAPLESLFADPRPAAAFDRREYRGVGGAIARGLESLRQQLNESADGRHREIAG